MIEAIEYATPIQLAERARFLEGRKRMFDKRLMPKAPSLKMSPVIAPLPPPQITSQERDWLLVSNAIWPSNLISRIKKVVAEEFGVTTRELESDSREDRYVIPRHVAMHLARILTLKSYPVIGRHFGNRDHTSIIHAVRNISSKMRINSILCQTVVELQGQIESELGIAAAPGS